MTDIDFVMRIGLIRLKLNSKSQAQMKLLVVIRSHVADFPIGHTQQCN